jgi:hypothetical protein
VLHTMREWFGLRAEKDDFTIETEGDAALFFGRHELDGRLRSMLRRAFRTANPPKLVLYGEWGIGKTHTMRHIQHVIQETDEYSATVIFVELPDISAKSTFQIAHGALLDAIGFERAKGWIGKFQAKYPNDVRERVHEFTGSGDIATAFANLSGFGDTSLLAWEWLRGMPLSATDARSTGVPTQLTQSGHFVSVLQMLGRLCQSGEEKSLVFMLDEATKLGWVTNQDAINHWVNALKLIADGQTKEIGFILSASWVDVDDMAAPLSDLQVHGRFGEPNYIRLNNLDEAETMVFTRALLDAWIEPERRVELMKQYKAESDDESVTEQAFPLTEEGLELAAAYACRNGGFTTPRDIQKTLDDLFNRAIDDERHILSAQYVSSLVNA